MIPSPRHLAALVTAAALFAGSGCTTSATSLITTPDAVVSAEVEEVEQKPKKGLKKKKSNRSKSNRKVASRR